MSTDEENYQRSHQDPPSLRTPEEWDAWHEPFKLENGRYPYWDELIAAIQADAIEVAAGRVDGFGMSTTCAVVGQAVRQLKPSTAVLTDEEWRELTKDRRAP